MGSSWMESLPSRNNFTHRATVRYGKAASPHASRSPWKQVCALRPHATSIFIQERWSSFVNMLGRLNWASTLQDDAQCNSIKHNHHHSLQLNFCYQVQTTVVSHDAHPSSYSSVASTLYPTLVFNAYLLPTHPVQFFTPSVCHILQVLPNHFSSYRSLTFTGMKFWATRLFKHAFLTKFKLQFWRPSFLWHT